MQFELGELSRLLVQPGIMPRALMLKQWAMAEAEGTYVSLRLLKL